MRRDKAEPPQKDEADQALTSGADCSLREKLERRRDPALFFTIPDLRLQRPTKKSVYPATAYSTHDFGGTVEATNTI
jgi:hypothetical protein